mmetsp:Transcript_17465/g.30221  ORF Transcript_17465/g.30221 Transcript_17465/m.30221 type:complete len:81 (+) Transcript_17465:280-522(+)
MQTHLQRSQQSCMQLPLLVASLQALQRQGSNASGKPHMPPLPMGCRSEAGSFYMVQRVPGGAGCYNVQGTWCLCCAASEY